jgi:cobalamin biosynthetic protein CobC
MIPHLDAPPLQHGGDLAMARRLFPGAPQPFIDLLNRNQSLSVPAAADSRPASLPAARCRGAKAARGDRRADLWSPSAATSRRTGTQILLPLLPGCARGPRGNSRSDLFRDMRAAASLAGHAVTETDDIEQLRRADLAVIANPNNPDGRIIAKTGCSHWRRN